MHGVWGRGLGPDCEPCGTDCLAQHASPRCRSAACRRRCALARLSCAFSENHRTGHDVGLAEPGFALRVLGLHLRFTDETILFRSRRIL
jgi:hypothetical protein